MNDFTMDHTAEARKLIAEELEANQLPVWQPSGPDSRATAVGNSRGQSSSLFRLIRDAVDRVLAFLRGTPSENKESTSPPGREEWAPRLPAPQPPGPLMEQVLRSSEPERTAIASALLTLIQENPEYRQAYDTGRLPLTGAVAGEAWRPSPDVLGTPDVPGTEERATESISSNGHDMRIEESAALAHAWIERYDAQTAPRLDVGGSRSVEEPPEVSVFGKAPLARAAEARSTHTRERATSPERASKPPVTSRVANQSDAAGRSRPR
ncbi:hypothetical protein [Streptomyces sp. NPDC050804]|uniref:hypothetical protein n=1 Tax=Streptomyces sp. NPDC050804 TaxID=3154745 RepID=UPI00343EFC36